MGLYSVVMEKIAERSYSMALVNRRIFFYGILFMLPVITIIAGWTVLKEPISGKAILGTFLILGGLLLSQWKKS